MFDNPFPVPSLCKLNHISISFMHNSMKIPRKQLMFFRKKYFFKVISDRQINFNITQRFLLRRPVFPFLMTMIVHRIFPKQKDLLTRFLGYLIFMKSIEILNYSVLYFCHLFCDLFIFLYKFPIFYINTQLSILVDLLISPYSLSV